MKTYFYNLIEETKVEDVMKLFLEKYPELSNNSKDLPKLFEWFKNVTDPNIKSDFRLIYDNDEVSAYDTTGESIYNHSVAGLGWRKDILMAEVDPEFLAKFSKEEIVVKVIWEMSYYGYAEEFRKFIGAPSPMRTQFSWEYHRDERERIFSCCGFSIFYS